MHSTRNYLLFLVILFLVSCSLVSQAIQGGNPTPGGQVNPPTAAGVADTAPAANTAAVGGNPPPTQTVQSGNGNAPVITLPPGVTTTPGIESTATAFIAHQTEMVGTAMAQMGPMAALSGYLIFYSNPVGTPVQTWNGIPILSQATAGQEFPNNIYSYKAAATLSQASQFYNGKVNSLHWPCFLPATGHGGTGSGAYHSATLMCGKLVILMTSFDNDTKHVLVVIQNNP